MGNTNIRQIINEVIKNGGVDDAKALKNKYIQKSRSLLSTMPQMPNETRQALERVLNWL